MQEGNRGDPGVALWVQAVCLPVWSESKDTGTNCTNNGFSCLELTILGDILFQDQDGAVQSCLHFGENNHGLHM